MAFFTIRVRRDSPESEHEDLQATINYLDLVKLGEDTYELTNGKILKLHHDQNGYALEPPQA